MIRLSSVSLVAVSLAIVGCPKEPPPAPAHDAGVIPEPGSFEDNHGFSGSGKVNTAIGWLNPEAVVLIVDGTRYQKKQLEQAVMQSALAAGIPPGMVDAQAKAAFEKPAYEKLIERQLLAAEAKKRGLFPTMEEAEAATKEDRERLMKTLPAGKTFADALAMMGTDETTFKNELQADVAVNRLMKAIDADIKPVAEADLKKVYDENIDKMKVPDTASASHIVVMLAKDATEDRVKAATEKAAAIRKEAKGKNKEQFAALALAKSEDPTVQQTKGDLGTFAKGDLLPELEAAAFALKDGEVSEPVRSDKGLHVMRGQGVTKGRTRTFEEVKGAIAQRERGKLLMQKVDELIEGLRKQAKIERVVEPAPSPFGDPDGKGSQVPAWRPNGSNAPPGMTPPPGVPGHSKPPPAPAPAPAPVDGSKAG
jgi:parvulin-like peptidyl-prolyl isomerase